ncbi:MAG: deferrochelatase/peroxidase EfeB [Alicyclobacillus shizuokensis]|nr:deferrochelatase/peroxidase EfeB [Alicyclobacillus shizuokensis]
MVTDGRVQDPAQPAAGDQAGQGEGRSLFEKPMSRREMLRVSLGAGVGLAVGASGMGALLKAVGGGAASSPATAEAATRQADKIAFYGAHQAGIVTPQQSHMVLAAFDLTTKSRSDLRDLLRDWTREAARMTNGQAVGQSSSNPYLPPDDTGEAEGLGPARLTVTFGMGPGLFVKDGQDVFGLAHKRPQLLQAIPPMPRDALQAERCGGDLCVQACADDPQVAFHAVRNLLRRAQGVAAVRWLQSGFLGIPRDKRGQAETPRNLMGFKDGTVNIRQGDTDLQQKFLWVGQGDQPAWMRGGTYMAVRRIRIYIEVWDHESLRDQEDTFGRHKDTGAPYGGADEFSPVRVSRMPANAHVRLAHGDGRTMMLRRGYSYNDGVDTRTGQTDAGLVFIAFVRNPQTQFIPVLRRLAENDALNEYIQHNGSALFACPPGARSSADYVGRTLLEE